VVRLVRPLILLALLLLAGCGGASAGGTGVAPAALTLSGPATAKIADDDVDPVVDDPSPELPVTVRSQDGADVEVSSVDRIVAVDLYGTLGEIVFSLGLGGNVVGRDSSTGFPSAAHVPVVTSGGHDLNAEAILDLDPTVVLTDTSIGPPEVQQQLRSSGIPVVFFDPQRTLEGVPDHIRAVAEALGVPSVGDELIASVDEEIAAARALAPEGSTPPRVTFLYVRGTAGVYLMAGPGSGADAMIEAVGGVDVGTDIGLGKPFVPITSEGLLNAAPDVILVLSKGLESVGGVDGLLRIPGVAQTPAGQAKRIVDVDDTDLLSFGPRVGKTITALATVLYGGR
jgi:iron complex transport system substrate-binding protein